MNAKEKNKIDLMIKELEEALKFENEEDRIEVKASFIQLDILDKVNKFMEEKNISRTELAKLLKKSKSFVSQLFSGDKKLNLKIIAQFHEIFDAKFIPKFQDYSEYLTTRNLSKNSYVENSKNKNWEHFNLKKYQEEHREEENKAA